MNFIETFKSASADLATLKIRTLIGKFTVQEDGKIDSLDLTDENNQAIESRIDLIDGDITTAMSNKFVTDPDYSKLREFHLKREHAGHDIIMNNINAIKAIIKLLVAAKDDKDNVIS